MTVKQVQEGNGVLLDSQTVADYLKDHPDFFLNHLDLLTQLHVPHQDRGAISLLEAQLMQIRKKVTALEEEITDLMELGSANDLLFRAFAKTHRRLFSATHLPDISQALMLLAEQLNLQFSLRLYSSENGANALSKNAVDKLKATHFCGNRVYLGRLSQHLGAHFFDNPPALGSYVLLPIGKGKELGFLSFASQDGGHFQPSMDTLFIEQIAEHVTILLMRWQKTNV